jgi:ATP-dependent Clp protease ATP-binding subunit ClpX
MRARNAYCSFCRKSYRDVGPLVEGPGEVYICGECVELCQSIIVQEKRRRQETEGLFPQVPAPEVIQERLNQWFVGQEEATKALAVAVRNHYAGVGPGKNYILLIGPTHSSKLFLARTLAYLLEVPFAHGAVTKLVKPRSKKQLVESVLYQLLQAADFDIEATQRGIVYLDGVDQRDAQRILRKMLEGKAGDLLPPGLEIKVTPILFIGGGTFVGLDQMMARQGRHPEEPITRDDLLAYGLHPDLVSRFQAVVRLAPLNEETLIRLAAWEDRKVMPGDGL